MNQPFAAQLTRRDIRWGVLWLLIYLWPLGHVLGMIPGLAGNSVKVNGVFFFVGFLMTALIFHRFLTESLTPLKKPLRVFSGICLGFIVYEVLQIAVVMATESLAPGLTANDETVMALGRENFAVLIAGAVILAPLTEETLVRGLIFGALREKSRPLAYILSALTFALMHTISYLGAMTAPELLANLAVYGLPGIALCVCYEYAGTIWAPVALHAALNALALAAVQM